MLREQTNFYILLATIILSVATASSVILIAANIATDGIHERIKASEAATDKRIAQIEIWIQETREETRNLIQELRASNNRQIDRIDGDIQANAGRDNALSAVVHAFHPRQP